MTREKGETQATEERERWQFEKLAEKRALSLERNLTNDGYYFSDTNLAYEWWQARASEGDVPAIKRAEQLAVAKVLGINWCEDLVEDGTPWEVVAEPEPSYFADFYEALEFYRNLPDTSEGDGELVKMLREALEKYKHCRHACIDCFCTKEAKEALVRTQK